MRRSPVASKTARHSYVTCAAMTARCRPTSNRCWPPMPAYGSVFDQPVDRALRGRVFSAVAGVLDDETHALAPGERLGTYEITGLLGAGGMGRVYRARDTTLGREVALKILPDLWLADPDRRARFEREARLLAVAQPSQHRVDLRRP